MAVQLKPWAARVYILAALSGCLVATAIVIIVSVVLSPGRIVFSVTHATRTTTDDGGIDLRITILANNTSHRAKVKYVSFFVVLNNSTSPKGGFTLDANVDAKFPTSDYLPGPGTKVINASLHIVAGADMVSSFAGHELTVVLTSQVRFLIGVARTKIFDVKVDCLGVAFVEEQPKPPHAQPAVRCDG